MNRSRTARLLVLLSILAAAPLTAQSGRARISETTRTILTYPFDEPNAIPILVRDPRLYPYHAFEGYARQGTPRAWKVVTLENDLIAIDVLPEVGGKVWGAVVKRTGREFIYRNDVLKFRNIALRGPWTSGGIEFNFGVVGHTPSTATPVDYILRENTDGSVSCIIGMMDLPSRTHWRVEIRLEPGRAAFETNVLWTNPTPLVQPYYNWMTAAAPARPDLVMTMPGNAFLGHPGDVHPWPIDSVGRDLSRYAANAFGSNKSYHVVGELADYFGGYYTVEDVGFGHWAPHDAMPGQKLWLWALSREGGIWEDLLTDTDGQYVEYQAGRLLVQYTPTGAVNPISQVGFEAGATDRWSESWFPLEGTGGLTAASREGAIHVRRDEDRLAITVQAFAQTRDTLHVWAGDRAVASIPLALSPLEPSTQVVVIPAGTPYRLELDRLGLVYHSDPATRSLSRPWTSETVAAQAMPEVDRWAAEARQLALGRRLPEARAQYAKVLDRAPWHRAALLGMAELEHRRGRYAEGVALAGRALQRDTYDAEANFLAATLHRALGHDADAIDGYGWAARSLRYRSVANVQLAEMMFARGDLVAAARHADAAIAVDRDNLPAREVRAMIARQRGDAVSARALHDTLFAIDPLHHFVAAERWLAAPSPATESAFRSGLQGEYPEQVLLELAIDYTRRGARAEAARLLSLGRGPVVLAWRAWLLGDSAVIAGPVETALVFPYRPETIPVLEWVAARNPHWSWRYLLALNLWGCDRANEAAAIMASLDGIDAGAPLATRALLLERQFGRDPVPDLAEATRLAPTDRLLRVALVQGLQRRDQWADAHATASTGRAAFPTDFNLGLLDATSLLQLGRPIDALDILDRVQVLPSEHARESHHLFQQAHVMAALDALDAGAVPSARRHLEAALEWPEHLGQGRPYQPEERLVRFLLAVVAAREGGGPLPARPTWTLTDDLDARLLGRAMELLP